MAALPSPVKAETLPMPSNHGFWFDNQKGRLPPTPQTGEPYPEENNRRDGDADVGHDLNDAVPTADGEGLLFQFAEQCVFVSNREVKRVE